MSDKPIEKKPLSQEDKDVLTEGKKSAFGFLEKLAEWQERTGLTTPKPPKKK